MLRGLSRARREDDYMNDAWIYTAKDGGVEVGLMASGGRGWLAQADIAKLFGTSVPNISAHPQYPKRQGIE